MATEAQIEANRVNAQKSTGPRTPEGKEKASQNALKHGLLTRQVVVPGEDLEEFARHREGLLAELAPAGPMESLLAERIVGLSWRLLRAERLQTATIGTLAEEKKKWIWSKEDNQYVILQGTKPGPVIPGSEEEVLAADRKVVKDFAEGRILDRLLVYEGRIEHHLYRTMAQLEKRQRLGRETAAASSPCDGSGASGASEPVDSEFPDGSSGLAVPTTVGPVAGVPTNVPEAETCKTNPILEKCEVRSVKCEVRNEPNLGHSLGTPGFLEDETCKTNPISGGAGRDEATGAGDARQSSKTNPIPGLRIAD